jgi:hypothetical protein
MTAEPTNTSAETSTKEGGGGGQVAFLMILMLVGFISGGYFFGTQLAFQKMEGGNPSLGGFTLPSFGPGNSLKKVYWIESKGYDRAGYVINVAINGQPVEKFFKASQEVDITKYLKDGNNEITFDAKSLPLDQRDNNNSAYLTLELKSKEKPADGKPPELSGGDTLLDYRRQVTDTDNFNDKREFQPIE